MYTIIVLSSDGYSDCWEPFFKCLKNNFSGVNNHEILLSTNTKSFEFPGLNIKTLTHGTEVPWTKRLRLSLEQAKNDLVLILVEDLFLRSEINIKMFEHFLLLMKESNRIDHIRLLSTPDRTKTKPSEFSHLDEIEPRTKLRFIYLPGLWKKNILLKYLFDHENIFMSEKLGDIRSWIYKHGFYSVSKESLSDDRQFYDSRPSGALFKGKWQNSIIPVLNDNNISIDFEKRGFVTDEFIKTIRKKPILDMIRDPISTFRSFFSIIILLIKSKF